ncbi:hypothetical protein [Neobacillus sp. D3-1R]|uniref:hypothetical protein n=1 Tax=Neobacillus sp. D3-1R TaxID=3445778 RepID=UPI003FA18C0F
MQRKKTWLFVLFIPFIIFGYFCYDYYHLDVYRHAEDQSIIYKNEPYVNANHDEFYTYQNERKFELGKTIGRSDDSHLFGFKETISEIKGKPDTEAVFMKGLMVEGVYVKKH